MTQCWENPGSKKEMAQGTSGGWGFGFLIVVLSTRVSFALNTFRSSPKQTEEISERMGSANSGNCLPRAGQTGGAQCGGVSNAAFLGFGWVPSSLEFFLFCFKTHICFTHILLYASTV